MSIIDIGSGAIDRAAYWSENETIIDRNNPANASGSINTWEFWFYANASGVKVGTFYGSGVAWTNRDYETIGNVASGSKQIFSGLDTTVETDDLSGIYFISGRIERDYSGGVGLFHKTGDQFGAGEQTYDVTASGNIISNYGTGTEAIKTPVTKTIIALAGFGFGY